MELDRIEKLTIKSQRFTEREFDLMTYFKSKLEINSQPTSGMT